MKEANNSKTRAQGRGIVSLKVHGRNSKLAKASSAGQKRGHAKPEENIFALCEEAKGKMDSPEKKTTNSSELEESGSIELAEETADISINLVRESIKFSYPKGNYMETEPSEKPDQRQRCMSFMVETEPDLHTPDKEEREDSKKLAKEYFLRRFSSFRRPRVKKASFSYYSNVLLINSAKSGFAQITSEDQTDYLPSYAPVSSSCLVDETSQEGFNLKEYYEKLTSHMEQRLTLDNAVTPKKPFEKPKKLSTTSYLGLRNILTNVKKKPPSHTQKTGLGYIDLLGNYNLELSKHYYENLETIYKSHALSKRACDTLVSELKKSKEKAIGLILDISKAEHTRQERERPLIGLTGYEYMFSTEEIYTILRIEAFCGIRSVETLKAPYSLFNHPYLILL